MVLAEKIAGRTHQTHESHPSTPQIFRIGNGIDLYNPYPTSRSESQKWAHKCFIHEATRPIFPPAILTGPISLDKLCRAQLGSLVRPDALRFQIEGSKRVLKEILEFGTTDVEFGRKSKGMIPFVEEMRSGAYLSDLFNMLGISGEPVVKEVGGIHLTFIRKFSPMDTQYEYSKFARVSVRTLG